MDACVDPERAGRVSFPSELAEGRSEGGSDQKNRRCLAEDLQHVSPLIQETYALISQGFLPPADLASEPEGEPCWTFESLAMILGIRRDKLVQILLETPRFRQPRSGAWHR